MNPAKQRGFIFWQTITLIKKKKIEVLQFERWSAFKLMWYSPDNTYPAKAPADELPMQQQSEGTMEDGCQHQLPKSIYVMETNVDVWLGGGC